ncbi:hypothetical protein EV643_11252 [Kribbella sp. VKM Ac-2527]|uniref:YCII-related domain-containing protein n=1 Tax=Kribbella caucasensis TaxID=2512215 RepID=A0A4V3C9K5_9ACTN|nr:YciI family protein [Kribbella sp. VKM Ac-2527]TDO45728.1 hypothetical protein EV643_11252 [Kribbella sp. VKM Ac-2527]
MKYLILIHSNPEPWGHPTMAYTAEGRALSAECHQQMNADFERLMTELSASGEFVTAEALAAPTSSKLYRSTPGGTVKTDGPYAEAKEHLAGFFLIDCATRQRAEEIAAQFVTPGDTVELRPVM